MLTQEDILNKVSVTLVEALGVEPEEVTPAASLPRDLRAESIDFLDIVVRLERAFGLKIPHDELFPESIFQGDPTFVQGGRVTAAGLAELRLRLPHADLDAFALDPQARRVSDLFTVGMIVRYVEARLAAATGRRDGPHSCHVISAERIES
jgi:acyl carrier protein